MVKNLIFLGAPGVGKGTVAKIIAQKYNLFHLSTGEIFRQEIANKTKFGQEVQHYLDSGLYVPSEVTNKIVAQEVARLQNLEIGIIFDGYPRTINQAQFLDSIIKINSAVHLIASDEITIKRLLGRKRKDDNLEVIQKRLEIYKTKTVPLLNYYQNLNKLTDVDFSGSIEANTLNLEKLVFNNDSN